MSRWQSRLHTPATELNLGTQSIERIQKQLQRAFRHSYGAESALRSAVRAGASEMMALGATADAVQRAIAHCVSNHDSMVRDKGSLVTGESRASMVTRRINAWIEELFAAASMPAAS